MSLNSPQQKDDDFLLGKAHRTVLPPSKNMPGSDSNKLPSSVIENKKLPSLVPEILLSSLQREHRIQLSKGTTLEQPRVLQILTQSDTSEELSPVRSVSHRTVLPKILSDANSGQSQRRVVLPQGKSETSGSRQVEQPDLRSSTSLHTMTKEEELEFLKLKLRYMQNDIELKRKQFDSAMMSKLRSNLAASPWHQSQKKALVQGGTFRDVQQTRVPYSGGFPAQRRMFHHRSPASAWAASGVSRPQETAAASMLKKYSDLQGRSIPGSVPAANNRSAVGATSSKSVVTGSDTACLTTSSESNKSCVAAGIHKSYCKSYKSSLVTDSNKSSMAAESQTYGLVTESISSMAAESQRHGLVTESISSMAAESQRHGLVTESISSMAAGRNSSSAAYLSSSQRSPLNQWGHPSSSADVRTVYPSCERTAPSHINTAHIKHVHSVSPQQNNAAHSQTAHKRTDQATSYPADPSVGLHGLNQDMLVANPATVSANPASVSENPASVSANPTSVFGRLGNQRISEMPKIVHESRDKRLVVAPSKVTPAVLPAASVAWDLIRAIGHTTSLAAAASEASPSHSLYTSVSNMKDVSFSKRLSHVSLAETCSNSGQPCSVTPANKYRFVKNPSHANVDISNTSVASTVSSVMLPSSLSNFASSSIIPNKDTAAERRGSPDSRLSLQNPKLNLPAAAEIVNKYKLKRLSPVSVQQAAPQSSPITMLIRGSTSCVANQAGGQDISQEAKIQHTFVSTYSLIKAPSHMPTISDRAAACGVDSVAPPTPLYGSSRNSAPSIQPALATSATRRASQGSRFSLRNPSLKIHTAAKLVSKYKFKRLSPTFTPQTAPLFYNRLLYRQSSSVQGHADNKTPGQYSRNQLKLDRRRIAINPANPQNKNFGDGFGNKFTVLTHKHNIDRRPVLSQSSKVSDTALPLGQFTIDKRRVSKTGLLKLPVMSRQLVLDRCWAGPRAVAAVGKLRSGARLSSKYSWKKPCLPAAAPSSRFKWSRPNVQAQNEAWQPLRQKLQLLLMKKHRNSRYSFIKYPTMAAASSDNRRPRVGDYKTNLVTIDGVTYRSSTCKLTRTRRLSSKSALKRVAAPTGCSPAVGGVKVPQRQTMKLISVRGVHFHVDQSGKHLCRTQPATVPGASAGVKRSISSHADISVVNFANRVIHRSIAIATAKYKKNNKKTKTPHCKFFSRFGKCHRGDSCPYVHDPEKVAVCTRFLRGRCDVKDCPFSHKASVNKMPVCLFYLRGSCSRDSCPYLHVRVNPSAPVCKDFRDGFCALGEKCKKIHSHVCPSFAMTGVCSRSGTCIMLHRASRKDQEPTAQDKSLVKKLKLIEPGADSASHPGKFTITPNFTVPLAAQPSFISLGITPAASVSAPVTAAAETVASLGTTPAPSFISLETTPTPSFISLETTPTPSFISLQTTPAASVPPPVTTPGQSITSLGTTPAPLFISFRKTPAPSFISIETRQQDLSSEKQRNSTNVRKLGANDRSADSGSGQDISATVPLLNIRPSFMTKKVSAQNS